MVLEIATIEVVPGREQAFEDAFRTARALPESVAGCHSVRMTRGVESPSRFVLLIEWESVRVHEEDFRQTDLFARWRAGEYAASDIVRAVDEAVLDLQERLAAAEKRIDAEGRRADEAEARRKQSLQDYASFGGKGPIFGPLTFSRPLALAKHSQILAELYGARSRQIALGYMRRTLSAVLRDMQTLAEQVATVADRLGKAVAIVEGRAASRVPIHDTANGQAHIHKLYDREHVRSVVKRISVDDDIQRKQTNELRENLIEALGERATFATFVERLSEWRLIELLEQKAEQKAEAALASLDSPRDRVLESSIIQKLFDEYGGRDEELRRFLGEKVKEAGSFAQFDPLEANRPGGKKAKSCVVAFVPAAEDLSESLRPFRAKLVDMLRDAMVADDKAVIDTRGRRNEITILSMDNLFPLRQLSAVKLLEERYTALIKHDPRRKKVELHTENAATSLPSLQIEGGADKRKRMLPMWLIAEAGGLFQERSNPETGAPEVVLYDEDQYGARKPVKVGRTVGERTVGMDLSRTELLQRQVRRHLAGLVHVDARATLHRHLSELQNGALESVNNNASNPTFLELEAAVQASRALIEQGRG